MFPNAFRPKKSLFFHHFPLFSKKGYKAPFLGPQDHARMKAQKSSPNGGTKTSVRFYPTQFVPKFVSNVISETLAKTMHVL